MAPLSLPHIGSDSRRNQVVQILREYIVNGTLQPGERLVEAELAQQLGVSRGPIREALRQLEQEGLVLSRPYRWTEVLGISQDEIEQVLVPIRVTLERFAFSRALPLLEEQDFTLLEALIEQMRDAARNGNLDQLAEADLRFHEHLLVRSEQSHCLQIWQTIAPRVSAYFRRDARAHQDPMEVANQHVSLLDALRTRDEKKVLPVLQEHIETYVRIRRTKEEEETE